MENPYFEAWFNTEFSNLYNYIIYVVGDTKLAEDLTAAVCEKALLNVDQYDPLRGAFKDWVFGIARNEARGYLRKQKSRPDVVSIDNVAEPLVTGLNLEELVQQKEMYERVVVQMAKLPLRQREVLALRYGAGYRNNEIADVLDLKEKHVSVILHRALGKLRNLLQEEGIASYGW